VSACGKAAKNHHAASRAFTDQPATPSQRESPKLHNPLAFCADLNDLQARVRYHKTLARGYPSQT